MNIMVSHTALKYLKKLDKKKANRIMNAIENLPNGDVKKLQGSDKYRLRIGGYRAIFTKDDGNIFIESVLPRGDAYK